MLTRLLEAKIHRVFINLIRNAVQGMPQGGALRITSRKGIE